MTREELESRLEERKAYLESNGIPYGEWGYDTEYVNLQNELNKLDSTISNNDTRVNEGDLTISELNTELDDIDRLIKEKEDYFNSNAIPYGEWGFDSEYNDLIGRKANLERERDIKSRELDEIERQIRFKENEFERNGIPYGEWQLDSEYVELLNSAERLKGSDKKVEVIDEPSRDVTPVVDTPVEEKTEEVKAEPIIIPPVPENTFDNPTPEVVIPSLPPKSEEEKKPEQPTNNNDLNSMPQKDEPTKPEALPPKGEENKNTEEKKETGLKVVAKKSWKWVKEHKKQILIALGLAAVTVSVVVILNQLIPALSAAAKASQISSTAASMLNNASLWHAASVGEQVALHGTNTGLSSIISTLTGKAAAFNSISGTWSIGGTALESFAIDAAAKASVATAKVAALSATALGFGIGGVGFTTLGAVVSNKKKSDKYKEYNRELKVIREKLSVSTYDDLYGVLPDFEITAQHIEDDKELSNDERKILLAKAQKIANRVSLIEKKAKKKQEKENRKEQEVEQTIEPDDEIRVDVNYIPEENNVAEESTVEKEVAQEVNYTDAEVVNNENNVQEEKEQTEVKANNNDNEWLSFFQRDNNNDAKTGEIIDLTGKVFVDMSSPNMNEEEQQTAKGRGGRR